jgi:hypothetical protein
MLVVCPVPPVPLGALPRPTAEAESRPSLGEGLGMANPWDIAPLAAQGDEEPVRIYHAVGLALSLWEGVETGLAHLYTTIINSESDAVLAAYGTVASGQGRLAMIVSAAEAERRVIDAKLLGDLRTFLLTEISGLAARRNDIAHGQVTHFINALAGPRPIDGHYLTPPTYNTRRLRSLRDVVTVSGTPFDLYKYAYAGEQIEAYADCFFAYISKVYEMEKRVHQAREHRAVVQRGLPP